MWNNIYLYQSGDVIIRNKRLQILIDVKKKKRNF